MLSFPARSVLAATQLAPLLGTYAFVYYPVNKWITGIFVLVAVVLVGLCKLILQRASKDIQQEPLRLKAVKTADGRIWAYVLGYLYPLAYSQVAEVRLSVLIFVFVMLLLVLYHGRGFIINPVMQIIFKYKFYEVVTEGDFTYVLVSRRELRNTRTPIDGRQLSSYTYLDAEG